MPGKFEEAEADEFARGRVKDKGTARGLASVAPGRIRTAGWDRCIKARKCGTEPSAAERRQPRKREGFAGSGTSGPGMDRLVLGSAGPGRARKLSCVR